MHDLDSGEPKIVGFESQPIPKTDTKKLMAITIGLVLLGCFLFCQATGTTFSNKAIEHSKQLKKTRKKYVSPHRDQPGQTLEEIQDGIDEMMRKNMSIIE